MKYVQRQACAFTTLVAGLSLSIFVQAAAPAVAAGPICAAAAPAVLHRVVPNSARNGSTFAVIRVTLGSDGVPAAHKLMWNSGDAIFNRSSMNAAALTAFAPASRACAAHPAIFDYAFVAKPDAKHVRTVVMAKLAI